LNSQKCSEILQQTQDGDLLTSEDLRLVEGMANNDLNPKGINAFLDLHQRVKNGYVKPYFLGVEYLTRDSEGFVYWKNQKVDHYDHDYFCSGWYMEQMQMDAELLARRCQYMEKHDIPINTANQIEVALN